MEVYITSGVLTGYPQWGFDGKTGGSEVVVGFWASIGESRDDHVRGVSVGPSLCRGTGIRGTDDRVC